MHIHGDIRHQYFLTTAPINVEKLRDAHPMFDKRDLGGFYPGLCHLSELSLKD